MMSVIAPTLHMEQDGSADFVLLVVDQNSQLAGVDTCMGWVHIRDQ